ncbi:MAG: glutamate--tRNA ligase [Myxococcales bacterium]|nr:glutamate--tRNA ligase [Myxococcales bacterium]
MARERVRFAPSPTGYLHIGGVRTALFNWLWARKTGGTFVLRIEDTDQERSTEASRQVILDSLRWLGLEWDEGPEVGGEFGPYTQMERLGLYKEYADRLISEGKAYRCYATKEELDAARAELKARNPKAEFRYPGWWRDKGPSDWLEGKPYVVRFKSPSSGAISYDDLVFGHVTTPNAAQQDFVLIRSDGVPLYNFGCVIDDLTMGITLVARGRDHMVNTPPQILLYQALGAECPKFAHLPMMLAASGEKLSKRHGAVSVEEYKNGGFSPVALLNYLVRFGWSFGDEEVFSRAGMVEKFDWERCNKSDGKFDTKKLAAINHAHLKDPALTPDAEYAAAVTPFLVARGLEVDATKLLVALPHVRERAKTYLEAAESLDPFFRRELVWDDKAVAKFLVPAAAPVLEELAQVVEGAECTVAGLEAAFTRYLGDKGLQIKDVAQPARVALTGRGVSPGIYETIHVLGQAVALERLRAGAVKARGA